MSTPNAAAQLPVGSRQSGEVWRRLAAVAVTVVLVVVLLRQASPAQLIRAVASLPAWSLAGAFACYLVSVALRTVRWSVLIRSTRVRLWDLFPVTCLHNFYNNLMPARTGEVSFVYLVRRYFGVTTAEGVAVLVTARVLDFLVICSYLSLLLLFASEGTAVHGVAVLVAAAGVAALLAAVLLHLDRVARLGLALIGRLFALLGLDRNRVGALALHKGGQVAEQLGLIASRRSLLVPLALSFASETCIFGMYAIILAGLGISLPFPRVAVGVSFAESSSILPVYSLAGFGTIELAWAIGFLLMGLSRADAILSGFTAHLVIVAFFLVLGLSGWALLRRVGRV